MSEPAATTVQDYDCDYAHPSAMPAKRAAVADDEPRRHVRTADDDLDYPIPYSEEKARQWASEDPEFCIETYKQDSYFTKDNQAKLRCAMAAIKAGKGIRQTYVNGEWVFVGAR